MKIIGSGMMAKGFLPYTADINGAVIFASGVSDSTLTDWKEYARECQLLYYVIRTCKHNNEKLVYFSSGGTVYGKTNDERREDMPLFPETVYGRHKLLCEAVIKSSGVNYLIARLPTVVGQTKSKKQLIPVLIKQALEGNVKLFKDAERDIIEISDAAKIIVSVLKKLKNNETLNIASGVSVSVTNIFDEIKFHLGANPTVESVNGGDKQKFNIDKMRTYCPEINFDANYYKNVIASYISELN